MDSCLPWGVVGARPWILLIWKAHPHMAHYKLVPSLKANSGYPWTVPNCFDHLEYMKLTVADIYHILICLFLYYAIISVLYYIIYIYTRGCVGYLRAISWQYLGKQKSPSLQVAHIWSRWTLKPPGLGDGFVVEPQKLKLFFVDVCQLIMFFWKCVFQWY